MSWKTGLKNWTEGGGRCARQFIRNVEHQYCDVGFLPCSLMLLLSKDPGF